jgi:hypothetical protein
MNPIEYPGAAPRVPPTGTVRGADRLPAGLSEAVDYLRRWRRTAEREVIAELPEDGQSDLQRQWRPMLTVVLGLDGANRAQFDELETHDPDQASFRIVEALWRALRREQETCLTRFSAPRVHLDNGANRGI